MSSSSVPLTALSSATSKSRPITAAAVSISETSGERRANRCRDDVSDAARHRNAHRRAIVRLADLVQISAVPDQLVHEEWIAVGLGVDRSREIVGLAIRRHSGVMYEQLVHRALVEPNEWAPIDAADARDKSLRISSSTSPRSGFVSR